MWGQCLEMKKWLVKLREGWISFQTFSQSFLSNFKTISILQVLFKTISILKIECNSIRNQDW